MANDEVQVVLSFVYMHFDVRNATGGIDRGPDKQKFSPIWRLCPIGRVFNRYLFT